MKSLRELYIEWANVNPFNFQKTLLALFGHVCGAFSVLADLPYDQISLEMFDIVINQVSSSRKRDNMRYLINAIDRYLAEYYRIEIIHPESLTDSQAVWMILHEKGAISCDLIRERIASISSDNPPIEVLGAKHIISLYGKKASETIGYRRASILLCSRHFGHCLSEIPQDEFDRIIAEAPSWILPMLHCTLKAISDLNASA